MKKYFISFLILIIFSSCSNEEPDNVTRDMIDGRIIGKWKVAYSLTLDKVKMTDNGELLPMSDSIIKKEFFGEAGKSIGSFMFGIQENIIEIKEDNKVKVFFQNTRGGVTVTEDYIFYRINNGMMMHNNGNFDFYYNYYIEPDSSSLTIERIPDENVSWIYKKSIYNRIEDF